MRQGVSCSLDNRQEAGNPAAFGCGVVVFGHLQILCQGMNGFRGVYTARQPESRHASPYLSARGTRNRGLSHGDQTHIMMPRKPPPGFVEK